MLILTNSEVQYCTVTHFEGKETETLLGLNYRGLLFVRSSTYAKNQFKNAIERCRYFLDLEIPVASIVVKEGDRISVWFENKKVKLVQNPEFSPVKNSLERRPEMAC
ncbi:MAG: hypothetical protein ACFBSE_10880 [Prochloraceae cyanobacterium]